jgi:hypothetical protein
MAKPTRVEVCMANHDHVTDPACVYGAKEAIIELSDVEIAELEERRITWEAEQEAKQQASEHLAALKTSARTKLIAGEPLTEEEAATIVL